MDTTKKSKGALAGILAMAAGIGASFGFAAPVNPFERRVSTRASKQSNRTTTERSPAAERDMALEHQKWNARVDAKRNAKALAKRAAKAECKATES